MRRIRNPLLGVALTLVMLAAGCYYYKRERVAPEIITHNLEQPTPAGAVPPASSQPQAQAPAPGTLSGQNESQAGASGKGQGDLLTGKVISGGTLTGLDWSGTITRFQTAYKAHQSPKIAIFLNRVLSDEIRDWAIDDALILKYKNSQGSKEMESYEVEGVNGSGARPNPPETWMWAFEDGFLQPFLDAGVKIIDRATIMRLQAAKEQGANGTLAPLAVKKIETDALKGYADVFIELLISANPKSHWGYQFKATAKSISTGEVLANVTSTNWEARMEPQKEVVATPNDYQVVEVWKLPTLDEITATMALELMSDLARKWE